MMQPANLSSKKAISFRARGDGKTYSIMTFSMSGGFSRAEKHFVAGKEWEQASLRAERLRRLRR